MTVLTKDQALRIIESTRRDGGYSHWFDGTTKVTGWSVGNGQAGSKYHVSHLTRLTWDIMGIAARFKQLGADGIGTWIDGGKVYVDPIFHTENTSEAMATGAMYGELAIYNLKTQTVLSL